VKGLILSAGLGTRLRPLTTLWPKPAMPLLGAPIFRTSLATLSRAGVTAVGVNTHHLPEVMAKVATAECARANVKLTLSLEVELQGTGGGIRGLKSSVDDGDFVVLNGDVLFAVDLKPIIDAHRASGAAATMVVLPMPSDATYNAVEVNAAGQVRRIANVGPGGARLTNWHFTGVHVMTPAVFDFMAKTGAEDINREVYIRMIEAGLTVRTHPLNERDVYWSDLGSPQLYAATHQALLFGQVPTALFGDADPFANVVKRGKENFVAHPSAHLADVRVSGPAWFGEACVLGEGVRIGSAVSVGPGASVGSGAMLNRVAVLDGAHVPAGALIEDAIIAPHGITVSLQDD
jgi:mannose-1-phosphate guanylyltransferase